MTRGQSEKCVPPKHIKFKSPTIKKQLEARLTSLEQTIGTCKPQLAS